MATIEEMFLSVNKSTEVPLNPGQGVSFNSFLLPQGKRLLLKLVYPLFIFKQVKSTAVIGVEPAVK